MLCSFAIKTAMIPRQRSRYNQKRRTQYQTCELQSHICAHSELNKTSLKRACMYGCVCAHTHFCVRVYVARLTHQVSAGGGSGGGGGGGEADERQACWCGKESSSIRLCLHFPLIFLYFQTRKRMGSSFDSAYLISQERRRRAADSLQRYTLNQTSLLKAKQASY
jgi:hypothetical protein